MQPHGRQLRPARLKQSILIFLLIIGRSLFAESERCKYSEHRSDLPDLSSHLFYGRDRLGPLQRVRSTLETERYQIEQAKLPERSHGKLFAPGALQSANASC